VLRAPPTLPRPASPNRLEDRFVLRFSNLLVLMCPRRHLSPHSPYIFFTSKERAAPNVRRRGLVRLEYYAFLLRAPILKRRKDYDAPTKGFA